MVDIRHNTQHSMRILQPPVSSLQPLFDCDLLVQEVAASLDEPNVDSLRSELQELDLLKYCRTVFENWAEKQ